MTNRMFTDLSECHVSSSGVSVWEKGDGEKKYLSGISLLLYLGFSCILFTRRIGVDYCCCCVFLREE